MAASEKFRAAFNNVILSILDDDNIPKFNYHLKQGSTNLKIGQILFQNENMMKLLKLK